MVWLFVLSILISGIIYLISKSKNRKNPTAHPGENPNRHTVTENRKLDMMPYAMFSLGPTEIPCPIHSDLRATIFFANDSVFEDIPVRLDAACRCRVRKITDFELERLEASGIQDSLAPPVLSDIGLPTGRKEKKLIPIEKSWDRSAL